MLEDKIADDATEPEDAEIVFLGDLIDRGPQSANVIDHLLSAQPSGIRRRFIAGNHEIMFLQFLAAPGRNLAWLDFGGLETLASYGISSSQVATFKSSNTNAQRYLKSHVPDEHVSFLKSMPLLIEYPHCILVHAGLRPGVALANQSANDLTGIRSEFLQSSTDFGKLVIHGHTPVSQAEHHGNRINVDTGAYATGCLSAARLEANGDVTFLTT